MLFHFVPHALNWVTVWGLRRGMPPVDSIVDKELSSFGRCMLGILILNESVPFWIEFLNHWQKCLLKCANIGNCIHAFKDANTWSAFLADGSPHMYLCRVFRSGFVPGFQTWHCTAESPMSLYLHCSFIGEDGIWEVISFVLSCPFQSLNLVDFMYHLAVSTATACPPKLSHVGHVCSKPDCLFGTDLCGLSHSFVFPCKRTWLRVMYAWLDNQMVSYWSTRHENPHYLSR